MRTFIIRLRNVLGVLALILIVLAGVGAVVAPMLRPGVPQRVVLELDLEQSIVEYKPASPLAQVVLDDTMSLLGTMEALERATTDDRVVGIVAKLGAVDMGFATVQELRSAILRFRAAGKPAVAFAETFGELGPGNVSYYLASAFDEIHLQPSGDIGLVGLQSNAMFLRGVFDHLEIDIRADHRKEYKNAKNVFTEKAYTPAHREAVEKILASFYDQVVEGIAEGRKLDAQVVRQRFDEGPYLGPETIKAGLIDKLSYWDEVRSAVDERFGDNIELLYFDEYSERAGPAFDDGSVIALVHGVGQVVRGDDVYDPLNGFQLSSGAVSRALRLARKDDDVKAIVFRVNSPGGSYVASDTIWREVALAKAAGKPVVVSMGDLAGSGGYFVAMNANKIVANPGTITGSIGVLGGKFITKKFWERFGLSFDSITMSPRAGMYSDLHDYSDDEWARFQAWLDRVYDDFTDKVAEGRGLPKEKVLEVAKGRIWTGRDAQANGLVDELGGLRTAIDVAKQLASIDADASIELRRFPAPKSLVQTVLSEGPSNSDEAKIVAEMFKALRPVAEATKVLGMRGPSATLETPVVEVR